MQPGDSIQEFMAIPIMQHLTNKMNIESWVESDKSHEH